MYAGDGNDEVSGGRGRDGGRGDDTLRGEAGERDVLYGDAGDDDLDGGAGGSDRLSGSILGGLSVSHVLHRDRAAPIHRICSSLIRP